MNNQIKLKQRSRLKSVRITYILSNRCIGTSVRRFKSKLINAYTSKSFILSSNQDQPHKHYPQQLFSTILSSRYNSRHNSFLPESASNFLAQLQSPLPPPPPFSFLPLFLRALRHFVAVSFRLYSPTCTRSQSNPVGSRSVDSPGWNVNPKIKWRNTGCKDLAVVLRAPSSHRSTLSLLVEQTRGLKVRAAQGIRRDR